MLSKRRLGLSDEKPGLLPTYSDDDLRQMRMTNKVFYWMIFFLVVMWAVIIVIDHGAYYVNTNERGVGELGADAALRGSRRSGARLRGSRLSGDGALEGFGFSGEKNA